MAMFQNNVAACLIVSNLSGYIMKNRYYLKSFLWYSYAVNTRLFDVHAFRKVH